MVITYTVKEGGIGYFGDKICLKTKKTFLGNLLRFDFHFGYSKESTILNHE